MIENIKNQVESKLTVLDAIIILDKVYRSVTLIGITNCFRHAGFCNVSTNTTQLQADSGLINNIDENYVQIEDDLTMSEIVANEDIVKNVNCSINIRSSGCIEDTKKILLHRIRRYKC